VLCGLSARDAIHRTGLRLPPADLFDGPGLGFELHAAGVLPLDRQWVRVQHPITGVLIAQPTLLVGAIPGRDLEVLARLPL